MFRKTFLASTLAAALAVTSITATPAVAAPDGEDFARAALGLLVIGAIASASRDNDRGRPAPVEPTPGRGGWDQGWNGGGHGHGRGNGGGRHDRDRFALPADCAFEAYTHRGWRDVYGARCLNRAGFRSLPEACVFEVGERHDRRTVYGARCLADFGYRTARGR